MKADMKKVIKSKAEKIKISDSSYGWVLPEKSDGLESGNGFRKLIIYSVGPSFSWVHKGFRKSHGKNNKKKK
jgi:hypothetical protein